MVYRRCFKVLRFGNDKHGHFLICVTKNDMIYGDISIRCEVAITTSPQYTFICIMDASDDVLDWVAARPPINPQVSLIALRLCSGAAKCP